MKKLTAGIFATILGLTAVDAFAAMPEGMTKVATTNYVAGAMNEVQKGVNAVAGRVTTAEGEIDVLQETVEGLTSESGNFATKTELTEGLAAKVDNSTYATDKAALESSISAAATKGEQGITDAAAALAAAQTAQGEVDALEGVVAGLESASGNFAAKADVEALGGRVTTAEGKITTAEGDIVTLKAADETLGGEIDALQQADVAINAALETKATVETVNGIDGRLQTAEGDINSLNEAISTKANASELTYYVKWDDVENEYPTQQ